MSKSMVRGGGWRNSYVSGIGRYRIGCDLLPGANGRDMGFRLKATVRGGGWWTQDVGGAVCRRLADEREGARGTAGFRAVAVTAGAFNTLVSRRGMAGLDRFSPTAGLRMAVSIRSGSHGYGAFGGRVNWTEDEVGDFRHRQYGFRLVVSAQRGTAFGGYHWPNATTAWKSREEAAATWTGFRMALATSGARGCTWAGDTWPVKTPMRRRNMHHVSEVIGFRMAVLQPGVRGGSYSNKSILLNDNEYLWGEARAATESVGFRLGIGGLQAGGCYQASKRAGMVQNRTVEQKFHQADPLTSFRVAASAVQRGSAYYQRVQALRIPRVSLMDPGGADDNTGLRIVVAASRGWRTGRRPVSDLSSPAFIDRRVGTMGFRLGAARGNAWESVRQSVEWARSPAFVDSRVEIVGFRLRVSQHGGSFLAPTYTLKSSNRTVEQKVSSADAMTGFRMAADAYVAQRGGRGGASWYDRPDTMSRVGWEKELGEPSTGFRLVAQKAVVQRGSSHRAPTTWAKAETRWNLKAPGVYSSDAFRMVATCRAGSFATEAALGTTIGTGSL